MGKDLAKKDRFISWIDEKTWQQADLSVFGETAKYFTENVVKIKKIVFNLEFLRSICLRIPYLKKYFFEYRNLSLII